MITDHCFSVMVSQKERRTQVDISTSPSLSLGSTIRIILPSVSRISSSRFSVSFLLTDTTSVLTGYGSYLNADAGTMVTKIFHPNISKSGEICVDTLKKAWTRNLGISDVLVVSLDFDPPILHFPSATIQSTR